MNIQSINNEPSFGRMIIRKGSLKALKSSNSFCNRNSQNHHQSILNFYKKLNDIKKSAENNDIYNVVFKPAEKGEKSRGRLVIENNLGREQSGFKTTFEKLTDIKIYEPKELYTQFDEPNRILRFFKNRAIKKYNLDMGKSAVDFDTFLSIVLKRIQGVVDNAEYLKERHQLQTMQK